jgi:hypothetical protein
LCDRREHLGSRDREVVVRAEFGVPVLEEFLERHLPFEFVAVPAGIGGELVNPARQPYRL